MVVRSTYCSAENWGSVSRTHIRQLTLPGMPPQETPMPSSCLGRHMYQAHKYKGNFQTLKKIYIHNWIFKTNVTLALLDLQRCTCFCLPSAGFKGGHHHEPPKRNFVISAAGEGRLTHWTSLRGVGGGSSGRASLEAVLAGSRFEQQLGRLWSLGSGMWPVRECVRHIALKPPLLSEADHSTHTPESSSLWEC